MCCALHNKTFQFFPSSVVESKRKEANNFYKESNEVSRLTKKFFETNLPKTGKGWGTLDSQKVCFLYAFSDWDIVLVYKLFFNFWTLGVFAYRKGSFIQTSQSFLVSPTFSWFKKSAILKLPSVINGIYWEAGRVKF